MMMRITSSLLLAAAFLFSAQRCPAEVPSGEVSFSFGRPFTPIYDLTGNMGFSQTMTGPGGEPVEVTFNLPLVHEATGRWHGTGLTFLSIADNYVAAQYVASGKVVRSGGQTMALLSVRLFGQDTLGGVYTSFSVTVSYRMTIDPATLTMNGTAQGRVSVKKIGSGSIRSQVSVGLPPGVDGSWTVQMNIIPLSRLGGSGIITLSNGRVLEGTLTGSYSPAYNLSKVRLSTTGESRGSVVSLQFTTVADNNQLTAINAAVLGQKLRLP